MSQQLHYQADCGRQTYVVGGFSDVAESWWGELGDDLLDLDVLSHDGGIGGRNLCKRVLL